MIYSIGTDIIEIERIKKASLKGGFLNMVFTQNEISAFNGKYQSMAGNFAAKEAVVKAFGTGFGRIGPKDIEVLRYENGKPYVVLHNEAKVFANNSKIKNIHISISHNKNDAVGFAVAEV